jgi:hypothetical protein
VEQIDYLLQSSLFVITNAKRGAYPPLEGVATGRGRPVYTEKKGERFVSVRPKYRDIPHTGRDGTTAAPLKGKGSTVF